MKNQQIGGGGECLKREAWTVCRFTGWPWQEEDVLEGGGLIPQCTLWDDLKIESQKIVCQLAWLFHSNI